MIIRQNKMSNKYKRILGGNEMVISTVLKPLFVLCFGHCTCSGNIINNFSKRMKIKQLVRQDYETKSSIFALTSFHLLYRFFLSGICDLFCYHFILLYSISFHFILFFSIFFYFFLLNILWLHITTTVEYSKNN